MKDSSKEKEKTTILKTDNNLKNGQTKCPKCGATDISLNQKKGNLVCNYCRFEFEAEKVSDQVDDISKLQGEVVGSGAQNIIADTKDVLTLKCTSCGAEVVIDTSEVLQARCHWCRNTLSINEQIPNGSVPDMVLPFKVSKEEARQQINDFVKKRKFFAHPTFKSEFTTENINGVYMPYMVVDVNAYSKLSGQGEHLVRRYTVGSGDDQETYYDADLYDVKREFDITIDDLTIESSTNRLENKHNQTNNIINSIMPFDTENCVKWDANYLKGYSSERRDTNVEELRSLVEIQAKDVSRYKANETLNHYDRGVCWEEDNLQVKGMQWKAAYLPVWLYSYQQKSKDGKNSKLHYVAVNARTKETMGSVPIHMPKLLFISFLVELLGLFIMLFVDFEEEFLFLALGFIFFGIFYARYRNHNARHTHEKETKAVMSNLIKEDTYIKRRKGLKNSRMIGANNHNIGYRQMSSGSLKNLLKDSSKKPD